VKVLVVDDNAEYAEMLQLALVPYADVDVTANGTEGFRAFCNGLRTSEPYRIICLDMNMPMRDGFETVQSIRLMEKKLSVSVAQGVKIVIVTGAPDYFNTKRALYAGAEAIVSKADGVAFLVEKIKALDMKDAGRK
jgi:two-component system chemotaxis response regulator CheY